MPLSADPAEVSCIQADIEHVVSSDKAVSVLVLHISSDVFFSLLNNHVESARDRDRDRDRYGDGYIPHA